jgi:ArsR family transcriptional regulator
MMRSRPALGRGPVNSGCRSIGPFPHVDRPCAGYASPLDAEVVNTSTAIAATAVESAALLAVVADPVRWRLLTHLAGGRTRCVCDLQPVAAVAPNLLSYHLKVLREAGLVSARRRGRWIDYVIADNASDRLAAALPTFPGRPR